MDEAQPLERTLLRVEQPVRCITDGRSPAAAAQGYHDTKKMKPPLDKEPAAGRCSGVLDGRKCPLQRWEIESEQTPCYPKTLLLGQAREPH